MIAQDAAYKRQSQLLDKGFVAPQDVDAALATRDLHQSVELARGTPGDGLSWSPDSRQLVAVIQRKLTVFTIQGGGIQPIGTGARTVSFPLWVLPNEIWYQSGDGDSSQMIRATR